MRSPGAEMTVTGKVKVVQPQRNGNGKSRDARVLNAFNASRRVSRLATTCPSRFTPSTPTKMADPRQRIIIKVVMCFMLALHRLLKTGRYSENTAIHLVLSRWSSWRTFWIGMRFLTKKLSMQ